MNKAFIFVLILAIISCIFAEQFLNAQELEDFAAESRQFFDERLAEARLEATPVEGEDGQLTVAGVYGVDFSTSFSVSVLQCLRGKGYVFSIPRGYQSINRVDPAMKSNVNNSYAAGFKNVDVYHFPCPKCGNPHGQFMTLWNSFSSGMKSIGMVWLDIEGTQYWSTQANNRAFYQGLLAAARSVGAKIGVYSSASQWGPIMGASYNGGGFPLWYAHYDNWPSFGDFKSFGGWSTPSIKQYQGDVTVCGGGVDLNVY